MFFWQYLSETLKKGVWCARVLSRRGREVLYLSDPGRVAKGRGNHVVCANGKLLEEMVEVLEGEERGSVRTK